MVDERTLVADIKSYIDELPGFRAEVEQHTNNLRMDLSVYYNNNILFSAEFKRPTTIEGKSPRNIDVVKDAFYKANTNNPPSRFFVTSTFNETILWDNLDNSKPLISRDVYTINLENKIKNDNDFNKNDVKNEIKSKMQGLSEYVKDLYNGTKKAYYKPLGDSFILGLNDHLNTAVDIVKKYVPENILKKWWDEQGYEPKVIFDDDDKEKISRYSLYVFSNKIVFYYVLKRSFKNIGDIKVDDNGNIKDLENEINNDFTNAKKISGDYETVFENNDADKILFMGNEEFYPMLLLIKFLKEYDFTKLSQDLLGNIYDRLISPEERHSNGQYYTPIPVVDLINALTIKNKDARVMDPACGSGTFLTRAFDLKLKLYKEDNKEIRENIMKDLFGCDISAYPAHLATIALASKLLMYNPDVYPNIIKDDFLNLKTSNVIPKLRTEFEDKKDILTTDLSGSQKIVSFKPIDAFVGNLPYIRQENINNKDEEQEKIQKFLKANGCAYTKGKDEYGYTPSNTADFHAYFWYYLTPFLKDGSRVGFLTSDNWLNVDYGQDLKEFINKYFKIVAIIDSSVERWFEDALVNTVITVLERTDNIEEIKNNKIKFIRINKKIDELINNIDDAVKIANNIENGISNSDIKIVREIRQGDIEFNDVMKCKLFPYLRGTDQFFDIVNNKNIGPLKTILDITYGIKTGANSFFYVEDITQNFNNEELKNIYGLRLGQTKTLRIIKSGDKSTHIIEKDYLRSILKGPKEFTKTGELLLTKEPKKYAVIINEDDKNKMKKYAREYIDYGENNPPGEPYSNTKTCKGRNPWWKLSPQTIPDIVFTALFSSTFMYPKTTYLLDHTLYLGKTKDNIDIEPIYAFLNSSISFMYPDLLGRNLGGGGAPVGFQIYEAELLPVPDPEILKPYKEKLETLMKSMEERKIGSVFEEIWGLNGNFSLHNVKPDRLELDRTILMALGFNDIDKFLESYYLQIVKIVKERLDKAKSVKNNKKTKKTSLSKVADEIIKNINVKNFPEDYIPNVKENEKIKKGNKIIKDNDLKGYFVSIDGKKYYHDNKNENRYVYYCALRGMEDIPIPDNIDIAVEDFENDLKDWKNKLNKEINNITSNEKYREKLWTLCAKKLNYDILIQ